ADSTATMGSVNNKQADMATDTISSDLILLGERCRLVAVSRARKLQQTKLKYAPITSLDVVWMFDLIVRSFIFIALADERPNHRRGGFSLLVMYSDMVVKVSTQVEMQQKGDQDFPAKVRSSRVDKVT
ncbi:hypothetical protein BaRGS_00039697, partial [Batillaria attramentaria]